MVKIGDKVRCIDDLSWFTKGREYIVIDTDRDDYKVYDDDNDPYWVYESQQSSFEPVNDPAELIALRAWKASAIARFPALEQPETDEEAAERFQTEFYADVHVTPKDMALAAFAWARENNR